MMSARRARESFDFAEAAQLQRDIVAAVVHDLGSITSALALRVDAARGQFSEKDVQAVGLLTEQLREVTRPLIWLRGSPGRGLLSPTRVVDVDAWWAHTARVASALLARGSRVERREPLDAGRAAHLPTETLSLLSMLLLGTCRHVSDVAESIVDLSVTLPQKSTTEAALAVSLTMRTAGHIERVTRRSTRWKRFCLRTAVRAGASIEWFRPQDHDPATLVWRVVVALAPRTP